MSNGQKNLRTQAKIKRGAVVANALSAYVYSRKRSRQVQRGSITVIGMSGTVLGIVPFIVNTVGFQFVSVWSSAASAVVVMYLLYAGEIEPQNLESMSDYALIIRRNVDEIRVALAALDDPENVHAEKRLDMAVSAMDLIIQHAVTQWWSALGHLEKDEKGEGEDGS